MTIKLSEPMRNVLMKLGDGWGWDDFGITGPLSYAARLRTCCALAKQGLVTSTHGDFNLTDEGEALAKQLKDQAKAAQAASWGKTTV
ncbi:hypothetical protein AO250_18555 [Pseudomonas syringae pv. actinidiae ICMP 19497]|uniref:Uncharacterized protein n=1 Tax=Pseudomonas syringae pv. actinidiae TaxID=103796 RepID=A0A2P0QGJ8_PSESF|nr:hypothetical protein [Pseudomonas syringae]ARO45516.1 hypothetical protein [Pseudomonas syringae pv. actinidiae]KTC48786.1 hypothetical protein AO250_18555 [Pseudomonas syringae pv. actinidiae ICMP 19497]OKS76144.1 hypothetical protein PsaNZ64_08750 [Pseudomonas syringae pv. actinidiae]PHX49868.1 hypothetical protein AO393_11110 [Pseudomonas syringae pv. syringae]TRN52560.1 hypothetical protein DT385_26135 [Pseudomonas syringae]